MNSEIVAAMRQVREIMEAEMLRDERRVAAFLADILGNQYPGERRLLKELVTIGIPRMIADGRVTVADLPAKAAFVAQKYLWNEAATLAAVHAWYETLQPEAPKPRQERPQPKPPQETPQPKPSELAKKINEKMAQSLLDSHPITLPNGEKGAAYLCTFSLPGVPSPIPRFLSSAMALALPCAAARRKYFSASAGSMSTPLPNA